MRKGKLGHGQGIAMLGLLGLLALALAACGSNGPGGGTPQKDTKDLWVERFSVPNFSGILLDEAVSWVLSEEIKPASLNHDSVRMRTGTAGGEAPRGTFVKGIFLIDRETGARVVVDPDELADRLIRKIEKKGKVSLVPPTTRYDLGAISELNGNRRVLFNHSFGSVITFVPEIPTRPDLSDTGYTPGATYSVVIPAFPALNTVKSIGNEPVLPREGRVFVSSFTTVPLTSPTLFLGGENTGRPRAINTDPPNGSTDVPADQRIYIRFSQPLDPRTITTDNFFLEIASIPGRPQIPVSLFLRQTRLGFIEVVMTPLQDLPDDQFFEVSVSSNVRDLLGRSLVPFVFSFTSGTTSGETLPIDEEFTSNSREDAAATTANWNGSKPFVGATPGAVTAVFAPFAGNGSDGAFEPVVGDVTFLDTGDVNQRVYNYTSINVRIGAFVVGQGNFGLVMRCQGDVTVDGGITVNGADGGTGGTGSAGDIDAKGGPGGAGGAGGFAGGDGAFATIGEGGNFDGIDGFGPGGGKGGGTGDQEASSTPTDPNVIREGGGGGGHATAGTDADLHGIKGGHGGEGGSSYGRPDFSDATLVPLVVGVPTLVSGFGGGGGGGGGGEDDIGSDGVNGTPGGEDEGGGGGGGGGGALQIVAYGSITVRGRIDANGGKGGSSYNPSTGGLGQGAPGGGGAGGSSWLQSFADIVLDSLARIEALGGIGGQGDGNGFEIRKGGNGGDGYIRLEDSDGNIIVPATVTPQTADTVGTFSPALDLDSVAQSLWYNQRIPTPNYGSPLIDADLNGGTIEVLIQGAREDVTQAGEQPVDPDTDPERVFTTDWIPLGVTEPDGSGGTRFTVLTENIDKLDDYQYLRFRINFSVDPLHSFTDPLPIVRRLFIDVSKTPD